MVNNLGRFFSIKCVITFIAISIKFTPIKYQTYKNKDGVSAPQLIKLRDLSRQINTDKQSYMVQCLFNF